MIENLELHHSWKCRLATEISAPYMCQLSQFLQQRLAAGTKIYPPLPHIFKALNVTPFDKVRVVILGQDPYHGPGQAHGLSFSITPGMPYPATLENIFRELQDDVGVTPASGLLEHWSKQGVLLLNSLLTVEEGRARSHANIGWEKFTDQIIQQLNAERENIVFILWGSYAQTKGCFIDREKHLVLEAPHPNPKPENEGFLGSKPFSKTNNYLAQHGLPAINW